MSGELGCPRLRFSGVYAKQLSRISSPDREQMTNTKRTTKLTSPALTVATYGLVLALISCTNPVSNRDEVIGRYVGDVRPPQEIQLSQDGTFIHRYLAKGCSGPTQASKTCPWEVERGRWILGHEHSGITYLDLSGWSTYSNESEFWVFPMKTWSGKITFGGPYDSTYTLQR